jgi:hypothetical protein
MHSLPETVWLHALSVQDMKDPVKSHDGTGLPEEGFSVHGEQQHSANAGVKDDALAVKDEAPLTGPKGPAPCKMSHRVHVGSQDALDHQHVPFAGVSVTSISSLVIGSKTSESLGPQPLPEIVSMPSSSRDRFSVSEQQPVHLQPHIAGHDTETASVTMPMLKEPAADATMDTKMTFLHYQLDQIGTKKDILDGLQLLGQRYQGGASFCNRCLKAFFCQDDRFMSATFCRAGSCSDGLQPTSSPSGMGHQVLRLQAGFHRRESPVLGPRKPIAAVFA